MGHCSHAPHHLFLSGKAKGGLCLGRLHKNIYLQIIYYQYVGSCTEKKSKRFGNCLGVLVKRVVYLHPLREGGCRLALAAVSSSGLPEIFLINVCSYIQKMFYICTRFGDEVYAVSRSQRVPLDFLRFFKKSLLLCPGFVLHLHPL